MKATILYELSNGQFHAKREDGVILWVTGKYKIGQIIKLKARK